MAPRVPPQWIINVATGPPTQASSLASTEGSGLRPERVLIAHLYLAVFLASAIDATGVPFPGRIILVVTGTFATTSPEVDY